MAMVEIDNGLWVRADLVRTVQVRENWGSVLVTWEPALTPEDAAPVEGKSVFLVNCPGFDAQEKAKRIADAINKAQEIVIL